MLAREIRELGSWSARNGVAAVTELAPGVLLLDLRGVIDSDLAEPIAHAVDRGLRGAGHRALMCDLENLTTYAPEVRAALTQVLRAHVGSIRVHVLAKTAIVRMGISLSNLALGGLLKLARSRQDFETKCAQVVAAAR